MCPRLLTLINGRGAVFLENLRQMLCDLESVAILDLIPWKKMHETSVFARGSGAPQIST
jgi:hypothetical protein